MQKRTQLHSEKTVLGDSGVRYNLRYSIIIEEAEFHGGLIENYEVVVEKKCVSRGELQIKHVYGITISAERIYDITERVSEGLVMPDQLLEVLENLIG